MEPPLTLADLYALVPAAEEEDLLEQHAVERHQQELLRQYGPWAEVDPPAPDAEDQDAEAPTVSPPTHEQAVDHAQAVDVVRHLLGATVLEER